VEGITGEPPGLPCWPNLVSSFKSGTGGLGGIGAAAARKRLAEKELRPALSSLGPFESKYMELDTEFLDVPVVSLRPAIDPLCRESMNGPALRSDGRMGKITSSSSISK
jgi:hypothetical protein